LAGETLIRAGALEDVSAIFGMHNEPGLPVGEFATAARSTPTSIASSSK
jgi:metal-dependent amidase/aminoacylase/carboxypeptidase family protein